MKNTSLVFLFLITLLFASDLIAQGSVFGIKGGPTLGFQQGAGAQSSALLAYHGILYVESLPAGNENAVFAQAGYHKRGSARRQRNFGNGFSSNSFIPRGYEFTNVSLGLGFKQKYNWQDKKTYYLVGFRGEYTLSDNLQDFQEIEFFSTNGGNSTFNPSFLYPLPGGVRKWNYGFMLGGGIEFEMTELVGGLVEFTVNPDLSAQYFSPPLGNVTDPFTGNQTTISERRFRNMTFELTFGIRLLRIVEYVD